MVDVRVTRARITRVVSILDELRASGHGQTKGHDRETVLPTDSNEVQACELGACLGQFAVEVFHD